MNKETALYWNGKLNDASRGSIADFQKVLVNALEALGPDTEEAGRLYVAANDWAWAVWVVRLRKSLKSKRKKRSGVTEPVTDGEYT